MSRRVKAVRKVKKKSLAILFGAALVTVTVVTGVIALLAGQNSITLPSFFPSQSQSGDKTVVRPSASGTGDEETKEIEKALPNGEARAVTIKAGRDFKFKGEPSEVTASIDGAVEDALSLTMDTIVIDTVTTDNQVLYKSAFLDCIEPAEFDPLNYAIEKARSSGMYVFVTYNITNVAFDEKISPLGKATSALLDGVRADAAAFAAKYKPDGVMIDGYYNLLSKKSYSNYMLLGGGAGFEDYMKAVPEALVNIVSAEFEAAAPSVSVGLLSEAVWANDYEDENGSVTKAAFSSLADGYADTLAFLDEGLADFIAVKAYGSIDDKNIPYQAVVSWWSEKAADRDLPFYIVHAASRAATDEVGWSEYDQLARQVIEARLMPIYSGSVYNSLERLIENPKECATKLIGYYEGSVKEEHIMQDLELTMPRQTTFTSFDPTVLFTGHTDPNTDATINDTEITTDENGYFQLEMQLTEGDNVFEINHKGKTVTYNITRITEVVKTVSPGSGTLNVDGATKLTIDAVAYAEAKVYAVIGGTTVSLKQSESKDQDDEYRDTAYARFSGVFTVPDATAEDRSIGAVTVYGEWNGLTKSKSGATIVVNKRMLPSDGTPVVVTSEIAETFRSDTISQYSEQTYFPLPKGALDYAVGDEVSYTFTNKNKLQTYNFYRLQSGMRVFTDDIAPVSVSAAAVNNAVTGCTVTSDDRYTKVILKTRQQVAYSGVYASDELTFKFNYTNSMPDGMKLTKNPLFSSVEFTDDTMTLKLREKGKFVGMYPYFDNSGNLVLRFNNPPEATRNNLSGAKIVIDPGHGGNDSGALGYLAAYPEKTINYSIATKLASILKQRGASVVMLNTQYNNYSLQQRVAMTAEADPHLFISIHSNSSAYNTSAAGTEAYYFNYWSSGLAQFVSSNVANALNTANRGQKAGYYYVTRSMQYPAILLETGFVSNQTEYHKLINEGYQSNIATAIANGIGQYLQYMSTSAGLSGTQTSGSSTSDAGQNENANTDLADNGISSQGGLNFRLSDEAITLSAGEEGEISAQWDTDEQLKIVWAASGESSVASLGSDGEKLIIEAKTAGTMTVIATVEGRSDLKAECVLTVE